MYCVKCGVELAESEKKCPLCGTVVFHPDLPGPSGERPYPPDERVAETANRTGILFVLTVLFSLPLVITPLCDWRVNGDLTWSGYVSGALLMGYIIAVLPLWFKRATPVVFVAADFAAVGLYLFYINYAVGGHWFLPFALPVVGGLMLIATACVALMHYVRRGYLYIIAGTEVALGSFMVVVEYLLNRTFAIHDKLIWSIYPLAGCLLVGVLLIIVAVNKTLRETLHKKFFL